jgi:glycosyltransferase involved in cell wall biosynthesis
LAELYRLADAILLPSEGEGFGIPLIEAGALRRPVVCTDLPVLREIAGDDATFVDPAAGPEGWADAVASALEGDRSARLARRVRSTYDLGRLLRDRVVPTILDGGPA